MFEILKISNINHKARIVAISNDAGSSEYLAHLVVNSYDSITWHVIAFPNSPASNIFRKLNIDYTIIKHEHELAQITRTINPDFLLFGTGWQIDFSLIAQQIYTNQKITTIGLLDHWTNYLERFSTNCIPKHIIVMDGQAKKIALETFGNRTSVIQLTNYFLEYTKIRFSHFAPKTFSHVVFISEPTSMIAKINTGSENGYGFTEYSAAEDICEIFDKIIIRLHPSDNENKYNTLLKKYENKNLTIIKPYREELIETLSKSRLTIGFDGMALYISDILGIKTISYMPNSDRKLNIPINKQARITSKQELLCIHYQL